MAKVDQLLVVVGGAICLVGGEIEIGIISPGDVPVEFIDREQLYGVHPKILQVWKLLDDASDRAVAVRTSLRLR